MNYLWILLCFLRIIQRSVFSKPKMRAYLHFWYSRPFPRFLCETSAKFPTLVTAPRSFEFVIYWFSTPWWGGTQFYGVQPLLRAFRDSLTIFWCGMIPDFLNSILYAFRHILWWFGFFYFFFFRGDQLYSFRHTCLFIWLILRRSMPVSPIFFNCSKIRIEPFCKDEGTGQELMGCNQTSNSFDDPLITLFVTNRITKLIYLQP